MPIVSQNSITASTALHISCLRQKREANSLPHLDLCHSIEHSRLQIARVPRDKAIGQDRYYLEIYQPADRMAWHFPIQLRREEGYRILGLLDAAIEPGMLGLSHSDGFPIYAAELYDLLEALIDAGLY